MVCPSLSCVIPSALKGNDVVPAVFLLLLYHFMFLFSFFVLFFIPHFILYLLVIYSTHPGCSDSSLSFRHDINGTGYPSFNTSLPQMPQLRLCFFVKVKAKSLTSLLRKEFVAIGFAIPCPQHPCNIRRLAHGGRFKFCLVQACACKHSDILWIGTSFRQKNIFRTCSLSG